MIQLISYPTNNVLSWILDLNIQSKLSNIHHQGPWIYLILVIFFLIRFGFSGENSPRCIIPTETISGDTGKTIQVFEYKEKEELRMNLVDFIHMLFFKLVNLTLISFHLTQIIFF